MIKTKYFIFNFHGNSISAIAKFKENNGTHESKRLFLRRLSKLEAPGLKFKVAMLYRSMPFSFNDGIVDVVKATTAEDVEILARLLLSTNETKKVEDIIAILDSSTYCYQNKKKSNENIYWTKGNILK